MVQNQPQKYSFCSRFSIFLPENQILRPKNNHNHPSNGWYAQGLKAQHYQRLFSLTFALQKRFANQSLPLEGKVASEARRMRCRMRSIRQEHSCPNAACGGYTSSVTSRWQLSRCGSGTLVFWQSTGLSFISLAPLRYLKGKPYTKSSLKKQGYNLCCPLHSSLLSVSRGALNHLNALKQQKAVQRIVERLFCFVRILQK